MKKGNSLTVHEGELETFNPITDNQRLAYEAWNDNHNLVLTGSAGTGKTFMALAFAFKELVENPDVYRQVLIIRSLVPTRDGGHLPGTKEEKEEPYTMVYKNLCDEIFGYKGAWGKLISTKRVRFETTSYIRGTTFDQTLIIVDEMQNMNGHELDTTITRVGKDCRIIFCGDRKQTDFKYNDEKEGIVKFNSILELMKSFRVVTFGWEDIVRSDFVRDYLMTKEYLGMDL